MQEWNRVYFGAILVFPIVHAVDDMLYLEFSILDKKVVFDIIFPNNTIPAFLHTYKPLSKKKQTASAS